MKINKLSLAVSAASLLWVTSAQSVLGPILITPITLNANHFNDLDTKATFASEVYTTDDIKQANAANIYDFLGQNTSLTVLPSYGNPYAQQFDMRGYGISSGYENLVITVNGRRLNNIDGVPQYLSNIDILKVERIEITKGSGSVVYGDGATAGAIHIYTNDEITNNINFKVGNFDSRKLVINAGYKFDKLTVLAAADLSNHGGFSDEDSSGHKTKSINENNSLQFILDATKDIELTLALGTSLVDTRYPGSLTLAQFNDDPSQAPAGNYTNQKYDLDNKSVIMKYTISDSTQLVIDLTKEDKSSEYISPFAFFADYEVDHKKIFVHYKQGDLKIVSGLDLFDDSRKTSSNITTKNNLGIFVSGQYQIGDSSFSMGVRSETVEYEYQANGGNSLSDDHKLSAFDIGFNRNLGDGLSLFTNLNSSYQAPNIDRFFNFGGSFNTFIKPAKVKTLNIGLNRLTDNSKSKVTFYYAKLEDEIYYNSATFSNTNIDKSHKYGLELQHKLQINKKLGVWANYAYTIALIDENNGNANFEGKIIPGVSKNDLTLGLSYQVDQKSNVRVSSKYRSDAFSANDFENKLVQKQKAFKSINVSYQYNYSENFTISASVENLFDEDNGVWVKEDAIYPVDFTRNIAVGFNLTF